jgi:tryptophan 2,3-dioxygenase
MSRVTYWQILKVDELLSLQGGAEGEEHTGNDEATFIIVHQAFELFFKVILRELVLARNILAGAEIRNQELASAVRALRRASTVFETVTANWRILETLTTRDYLVFRDKLGTASGFQSGQVREIEILMGLDDAARVAAAAQWRSALLENDGKPSKSAARVAARVEDTPTLRTALYDWLSRIPIDGSRDQAHIDAFLESYIAKHRAGTEARLRDMILPVTPPSEWPRLRELHERDMEQASSYLMATDTPDIDEVTRAYKRRVRAAIVFVESYRELPRLTWAREIVDATLELEQAMLIWRGRHVRMVERVIGRRPGTGSAGVAYLD